MLGRAAQGDLAQRNQIPFAEKVLRCTLGLLRQIDLARFEPCHQLIGRDVHQDDLIGAFQHRVGNGLVHANAGDRAHRVVQTFEVLDIERRPDVDTRIQKFLHVLPPLGVA